MDVFYKLDPNAPLSDEQLQEIEDARCATPVFDEDSPAYSFEQLQSMQKLSEERNAARQRELISLRVDHESIAMAKSFGKGYTNLFSRLIYIGMRDPEILKRAL